MIVFKYNHINMSDTKLKLRKNIAKWPHDWDSHLFNTCCSYFMSNNGVKIDFSGGMSGQIAILDLKSDEQQIIDQIRKTNIYFQ